MGSTLTTVHTYLGYFVVVAVLVAAVLALRGPSVPPVSRTSSLTMVLLDVHVTLGIVLYVVVDGWAVGAFGALVAYVHPALALAALGVGHAALARARRSSSARVAGTGLLGALVLVVAAVGVARAA